jgi:hypothetical protein
VFFLASVTLRGVTVVDANPYSLPFVCLWLANVAVGSGLILVVSAILVWVPVYDGRLANARLGGLCAVSAVTELYPPLAVASRTANLPLESLGGLCPVSAVICMLAWHHKQAAIRLGRLCAVCVLLV